MNAREADLNDLLGKVFDEYREELKEEVEPAEYERRRHDFVFHMTDWLSDLADLSELYHRGNAQNLDDAAKVVVSFLYHVIPHLSAAGRLLLDEIPDAFAKDGARRKPIGRRKKVS